jgi:cytochrome c oxidase assembly protein subunit 11
MSAPRAPSAEARTAGLLAGLVALLAFTTIVVIPPFYDWFCRVTGFGGTTATAESAPDVILDRTMIIRFDASLAAGMPWQFKPVAHKMEVRIGETGLAYYEAHNPTDRPVAGRAVFNVFPYSAGGYFTKIDCFCFQEQVLMPGERVEMPVSFYVDPALVDDPDAGGLTSITLSYTFNEIPLPEAQASLAKPAAGTVN